MAHYFLWPWLYGYIDVPNCFSLAYTCMYLFVILCSFLHLQPVFCLPFRAKLVMLSIGSLTSVIMYSLVKGGQLLSDPLYTHVPHVMRHFLYLAAHCPYWVSPVPLGHVTYPSMLDKQCCTRGTCTIISLIFIRLIFVWKCFVLNKFRTGVTIRECFQLKKFGIHMQEASTVHVYPGLEILDRIREASGITVGFHHALKSPPWKCQVRCCHDQ